MTAGSCPVYALGTPTSGPPGQYVHFPWGQAYGLGITATVVTPLALRTCLPIRRGLSRMSSESGTRWRRSELGGTVGELCSLQTSILIRLTSSREGLSRLSKRSMISVETCSVVWLNPFIHSRLLSQGTLVSSWPVMGFPYTRPLHGNPRPSAPLTVESMPIP